VTWNPEVGLPWTDPNHAPPAAGPDSTQSYSSTSGGSRADEGSVRVLESGRLLNQGGVPAQEPASRIEIVAIDEFVGGTASPLIFETAPHLEHILGMYDQLAIQVVTDSVASDGPQPQLQLDIYHSADGLNWIKKRGGSVHEIVAFLLFTNATTYVPIGYDDGTTPSLAFVKLQVTIKSLGATKLSAHVNVRVTCNDAREAQFERQLAREFKRETKDLPAEYWKRMGTRQAECMKGLNGVKNPNANKIVGYHPASYVNGPRSPIVEQLYCVEPGSPGAVAHCVALGFSKYWAEQEGKARRKAAEDAEKQHQEDAAHDIKRNEDSCG
jgi:hypothetical protein